YFRGCAGNSSVCGPDRGRPTPDRAALATGPDPTSRGNPTGSFGRSIPAANRRGTGGRIVRRAGPHAPAPDGAVHVGGRFDRGRRRGSVCRRNVAPGWTTHHGHRRIRPADARHGIGRVAT